MARSKIKEGYHHGDLRNAIVEAAKNHVEQTQEWNFSLRGIANIVGVSHNAPYMHFANKRALLAAVGAQGFVMLNKKIKNARTEKNKAGLVAAARSYVEFGRDHSGLYRLMFGPVFATDSPAEFAVVGKESFALLVETIAAISNGSSVTEKEVVAKAFTVWGLMHGLTLLIIDQLGLAQTFSSDDPLPSFIDVAVESMVSDYSSAE